MVIINPETFPVNSTQLSGLASKSGSSYTSSETATLTKKIITPMENIIELDMTPHSITTIVINN